MSSTKRSATDASVDSGPKRTKGLTESIKNQIATVEAMFESGVLVSDASGRMKTTDFQQLLQQEYQKSAPKGRVTLWKNKDALQHIMEKHSLSVEQTDDGTFFSGVRSSSGFEESKASDIAAAMEAMADDSEMAMIGGAPLGLLRQHLNVSKALVPSATSANCATFVIGDKTMAIFMEGPAGSCAAASFLPTESSFDDTIEWSNSHSEVPPPFSVPFTLVPSVSGANEVPPATTSRASQAMGFHVVPVRKALDAMKSNGVTPGDAVNITVRNTDDVLAMSFTVPGNERQNSVSQLFTVLGSHIKTLPRMHPGSAKFLTVSVPVDDWRQAITACADMNTSHVYIDAKVTRVGGKASVVLKISSMAVEDGRAECTLVSADGEAKIGEPSAELGPFPVALGRKAAGDGMVDTLFSSTTLYAVDKVKTAFGALFGKGETMTLVVPEEEPCSGSPGVSMIMASLRENGLVQAASVVSSNREAVERDLEELMKGES